MRSGSAEVTAVPRGIPYVWFLQTDGDQGVGHEVKDIRSGQQFAVDPQTWTPPADDLHPRVVAG